MSEAWPFLMGAKVQKSFVLNNQKSKKVLRALPCACGRHSLQAPRTLHIGRCAFLDFLRRTSFPQREMSHIFVQDVPYLRPRCPISRLEMSYIFFKDKAHLHAKPQIPENKECTRLKSATPAADGRHCDASCLDTLLFTSRKRFPRPARYPLSVISPHRIWSIGRKSVLLRTNHRTRAPAGRRTS